MVTTSPDLIYKIKVDRTRHRCFTSRDVELIHDTLYEWGWSTTFNPSFSVILDDIALIQLLLSTITLQFLFPILVNMRKVIVLLQSLTYSGCV